MTPPTPTPTSNDVQLLNVWWEVLMSMSPQSRAESEPLAAFWQGWRSIKRTDPAAIEEFTRGKRSELRKVLLGCQSRSGAYELAGAQAVAAILEGMGLVRTVGPQPRDVRDAETGRPVATRLREVARMRYPWDTDDGRQWLRDSWPAIMSLPMADLKRALRETRATPTPVAM